MANFRIYTRPREQHLTPEYPPEVKPERVGVYKTRIEGCSEWGYSVWNGLQWSCEEDTPERAATAVGRASQKKHWQGLAEDPGKRADLSTALDALLAASNYIDKLGGDSKRYRGTIEALKETT